MILGVLGSRSRDQAGQATVEYVGILVMVAAVIAAVAVSGLGGTVGAVVRCNVERVLQSSACSEGHPRPILGGGPAPPDARPPGGDPAPHPPGSPPGGGEPAPPDARPPGDNPPPEPVGSPSPGCTWPAGIVTCVPSLAAPLVKSAVAAAPGAVAGAEQKYQQLHQKFQQVAQGVQGFLQRLSAIVNAARRRYQSTEHQNECNLNPAACRKPPKPKPPVNPRPGPP